MYQKLKRGKKGFTLAELLIVIAIIAILAAIAIPIYSTQMDNATKRVNMSNLSAATHNASSDYLVNGYTGTMNYSFSVDANNNLAKDATAATATVTNSKGVYTTILVTITDGGAVSSTSPTLASLQ